MTAAGHILIVDDHAPFARLYRQILESEGLVVSVAHSAAEATSALESNGPELDVVLLDQKLQGPGGPDTGLDLIEQVTRLAPFAKPIIVTAYATPAAIEQAFELGVYDHLVKNGAFDALLRAKVRNAVEITSEQRQNALKNSEVISELRATWARVRTERDRNRKGKLLEELVKLLFHATPGFGRVTTRLNKQDRGDRRQGGQPLRRSDLEGRRSLPARRVQELVVQMRRKRGPGVSRQVHDQVQ